MSMTEPRKMGPGGVPFTRDISRRASTALEPYIQRAGEAQLEARDGDDFYEKIAARTGLSEEEAAQALDIEGSIQMSAIVELLLDLQHISVERNIDMSQCLGQCNAMYRRQAIAFARRLVYEIPDDDAPTGPPTDMFFGGGL
jgi:hypothetical protein